MGRSNSILIITILTLILSSCNNGIISKDESVTDANNILYQKGKSHPYTGMVRTYRNNDKTKIISEAEYQLGKRNGVSKDYYDNDSIQQVEYYKNGLRDSVYIKYWSNGAIKRKGYYRNDTQIGIWIEYDRQGTVTDEHDYDKQNRNQERAIVEEVK